MSEPLLYFDNNATTAPDPAVVEAMLPWLSEAYGNPSSSHAFGQRAADALAEARGSVARLLGATAPAEVTFTSGGTESLNTAIASGLAAGAAAGRTRIVTSRTEHAAVESAVDAWERRGREVVRVGVDAGGRLDLEAACAAVDESCALVTLLWANNETGVCLARDELETVGQRCRDVGARFGLDAVQAAGKVPLRVAELPVDLVSISAHKLHGPKGAGALWVRSGLPFAPLLFGGPQEADRRPGTENVPGICGLGRAAELALAHLEDGTGTRIAALRDRLERELQRRLPSVRVTGDRGRRVANTTSVVFPGLSGEALVMLFSEEGLAASTGSACDSGHSAPSHVLRAMGLSDEDASASIRFSLSRFTTEDDVDRAADVAARCAETLLALAAGV